MIPLQGVGVDYGLPFVLFHSMHVDRIFGGSQGLQKVSPPVWNVVQPAIARPQDRSLRMTHLCKEQVVLGL